MNGPWRATCLTWCDSSVRIKTTAPSHGDHGPVVATAILCRPQPLHLLAGAQPQDAYPVRMYQ